MEYSETPQTQREVSPQKVSKHWKQILKKNKVRVKNYLYFLIYKSLLQQSWSLLEWKLAEESSKLIRNQLPELYILVTFLLLEIKERRDGWYGANYYFQKVPHWIPRSMVRTSYGVGRGESLNNFLIIQEELASLSETFLGNNLFFELGVTEDPRSVLLPQRKRGYHDHGSSVPAHKRGRNISLPGEPNPDVYSIGEDPLEDVRVLDLLGTTEFFFFQNHSKK